MKACKIDIKQTWIDLPSGIPVYTEAIREQIMASFKEDGKMPDVPSMRINTYYPVQVSEPGQWFKTTVYLIKENEEKIFKDLLTIQDTELTKAIEHAVYSRWVIRHYDIERNERNKIRVWIVHNQDVYR